MRVIIAGSRGISDPLVVDQAMRQAALRDIKPTVVLSGTAPGADRLGETWAHDRDLIVEYYPADWKGLGRVAGYRRNEQMAKQADALVAIWNGKSPGTRHMITQAQKRKLRIYVHYVEGVE
jgi:hypothetical protein